MNDQARKLLAYVIHRYGVDVIQTPKHLLALLKDHAKGQFKPEISLFMQAVTEGLVIKLLTNQYASVQALSARAIKHLQQDCFIEEQAAHWVIDSWCIALKLARPILINPTPTPVAQAKPSPVAVIKSPVPPPTPTVQATPVPVIQGASSRKPLFFVLFLVVVVFLAISNKPDKTPAGVGTQEDSARKPRATLNWHDGASFTIEGDPNEQMYRSAGVATQEDSARGAEQTEDIQKLNAALNLELGNSSGTDPLGRPLTQVLTPEGTPVSVIQRTQFGVAPSPYASNFATDPDVPEYQKRYERKLRPHIPAEGLYEKDGKPTPQLLEGARRVKLLAWASQAYKEDKLTPEKYKEYEQQTLEANPDLYLDGNAYLKNLHADYNATPSSVPYHTSERTR